MSGATCCSKGDGPPGAVFQSLECEIDVSRLNGGQTRPRLSPAPQRLEPPATSQLSSGKANRESSIARLPTYTLTCRYLWPKPAAVPCLAPQGRPSTGARPCCWLPPCSCPSAPRGDPQVTNWGGAVLGARSSAGEAHSCPWPCAGRAGGGADILGLQLPWAPQQPR